MEERKTEYREMDSEAIERDHVKNDKDLSGSCGGRKLVGFEIYFKGRIGWTWWWNKQGSERKGSIGSLGLKNRMLIFCSYRFYKILHMHSMILILTITQCN